jgi:hypothetical protein
MLDSRILSFYQDLELSATLPEGVEFMNPYQHDKSFTFCSLFYRKYYHDDRERTMILGINPGRFGGGITGIPFTDPQKLEVFCGIENDFRKKTELSADFIYTMINAFGGPEKFYGQYYFSAISPLGFTKDEKNLNYYDLRELQNAIEPFAVNCLRKQLTFGMNQKKAFCLGEGENFKYLSQLNNRYEFFKSIVPLPHPRFIMQYRRKQVDNYIQMYLDKLRG